MEIREGLCGVKVFGVYVYKDSGMGFVIQRFIGVYVCGGSGMGFVISLCLQYVFVEVREWICGKKVFVVCIHQDSEGVLVV